jgi:hypothetical protein
MKYPHPQAAVYAFANLFIETVEALILGDKLLTSGFINLDLSSHHN